MDLDLTDEQQMLRDAVRGLCEQHSDPDTVRALEDDPVGFSRDLWNSLASMDIVGLTLPTDHGGSGMGILETAVVHEELGRAIAPTPLTVSSVLGGALLSRRAPDDLASAWLPRMARGEAIVSLAWTEPDRGEGPDGVGLTAQADGDDLVLSGTKIMVPFAEAADAFLVLVRLDGEVRIVFVEADVEGLTRTHTPTLASDASGQLDLDSVRVPQRSVFDAGWGEFLDAMDDALIALAAYAVGGATRAHEMAVEYAGDRVQFGVPIGNFQGIAHPLADMKTEIDGARVLVWEAAWTRDVHGELGPLAAMAKATAAEVFRRTGRVGHQVFGGIGFTRAIDMQLYFRRAKQLEIQWFGTRTLHERIAAAELDAPTAFVTPDTGHRPGSGQASGRRTPATTGI